LKAVGRVAGLIWIGYVFWDCSIVHTGVILSGKRMDALEI
jgi:hypothetical protein